MSAAAPGVDPAFRLPERLRPSGDGRIEERAPGRFAGGVHAVARAVAKPLRIFELAQLRRRIDEHVGIRADAERAAASQKEPPVEDAVAEIALGDRTEPGGRAAPCKRFRLRLRHVRRVDQAPAWIDVGVLKQPFDRTHAGEGERRLHLLHLLRGVDVDRAVGHRRNGGKLLRRDGAQAVRRDADIRTFSLRHGGLARREELREAVEVGDEAPLAGVRRSRRRNRHARRRPEAASCRCRSRRPRRECAPPSRRCRRRARRRCRDADSGIRRRA